MKLFQSLTVVALLGVASGASVTILDQHNSSIGSIVEQVCSHKSATNKQISKISTVVGIADQLASLPPDHKLAACAKLYLGPVRDLVQVLAVSNHNVCSANKISAIQKFHRAYILKGSQRTGKAPKVLVNFFIHYVNSISDICATETAGFLAALNNSPPETNTDQVDALFSDQAVQMGRSSSTGDILYPDIFLVWPMVDLLASQSQHKARKYVFGSGEKRRVALAARNPEGFLRVQELCRTKAKPLYSYSLMSTLRLIDMGYYPSSSSGVLDQLNGSKKHAARRFYQLTKLCEMLLPVTVFKRDSTDSEPVLLTRQEVEELGLRVEELEVDDGLSCHRCSITGVNTIASVTTADAVPVAKRVKGNIKSRRSAVSKVLKDSLKNAKTDISGKLKRLFREEAPEDVGCVDDNQLDDIYELSEVLLSDEDDPNDNSLHRTKRNYWVTKVLVGVCRKFVEFFMFILIIIWGCVTLFILRPIALLVEIFTLLTNKKYPDLQYFLTTGGGILDF